METRTMIPLSAAARITAQRRNDSAEFFMAGRLVDGLAHHRQVALVFYRLPGAGGVAAPVHSAGTVVVRPRPEN